MNTAALRRQSDSGPTRIVTRFGEFDAEPADVLSFPQGLPGFEPCRQFVLLSADDLHPLQCLHAVAGPPASFLVIDPRVGWRGYRCVLRIRTESGSAPRPRRRWSGSGSSRSTSAVPLR